MPKNSKIFLILLLGTLSAFGPFVVDLYLPALPQLATFFQTSPAMTQLTLTTAMIGLAVGQLILGPISDKFGRKKPLLISLFIYIISTALIIFSPNIETLIVLRTIQGLASAGSVVISRAVATDLYRGRAMTRFFGLLMTINGLAPIISPVLGSLLLEYISWHGIFIFLMLIGITVLAFCFRLAESLRPEDRLHGSILSTFGTFTIIAKNKLFMCYVAIQSFLFATMFAYIASSPFILQSFYGLSAFVFSLCFSANGSALVIGANIGGKLTNRKALALGVSGFAIAAIYTIAMLLIQPYWLFVEIGFFLMLLLMGLTFPAISSLAMGSERKYAGSASALLGFTPFFLGGIISPLVGIGNIFYATSLVIFICAISGTAVYLMIRKKISS